MLSWDAEDTVETVCLLSKLNVKQHIEVELTMDEMDLTAAEKKASYEEIKAYVLEKFGMKVSHLYIAQVKRKCGIIERENYNKPKSENARQPQCPPEKEAPIRGGGRAIIPTGTKIREFPAGRPIHRVRGYRQTGCTLFFI